MHSRRGLLRNVRAQSMAEVAIFGTVIIFLIGLIVQSVLTTSFAQHYALRTMREALTQASAEQTVCEEEVQKPYNLMIIEDRLFPVVSKYGATERVPHIGISTPVFSKDLFRRLIYNCNDEAPKLYLKVNGTEREYTLGQWRQHSGQTCLRVAKNSGSGKAWKVEEKNIEELIDETEGFAPCVVQRGDGRVFPAPVFRKPYSDPHEYWMFDPTAGQMNPYDETQGLQPLAEVTTTNNSSLSVDPGTGSSSVSRDLSDTICHYFEINSGQEVICGTISDNRGSSW